MISPAATPVRGPAAPRWVRRYVAVFLVVFTVCGVFGIEAWPLTGWRLFADARERVQPGWQATVVDASGRDRPIDFRALPAGFQGNVQVLKGFPSLDPGERQAVCDAWAAALREHGREVAAIRIYATRTDVGDRRGARGAPPARTFRYTCQGGQVQETAAFTPSGQLGYGAWPDLGPPASTLARRRAAVPALSTGFRVGSPYGVSTGAGT
jgi:hypothetical protein